MPEFRYEAMDAGGKRITDSASGKNREEVLLQIQSKGLILIRWMDRKGGRGAARDRRKKGMKPAELLQFTRDLAHLMKAELPMDRALTILEASASEKKIKEMAGFLRTTIREGSSLSEAMAEKGDVFSDLYVNMVRVGEMGGILPSVMEKLAGLMERTEEIKGFIISTSIYPSVLMGVGLLSILVIMGFVVPSFAGIFADLGQELPLSTKILLDVSVFLRSWWWALILLAGGTVFAVYTYALTETGRRKTDSLLLKVPKLGEAILEIQVSRFARTLGTLVRSGVPLLKALSIVGSVVGNVVIRDSVEYIYHRVKEGKPVSRLMGERKIFPPIVVQMTSLGEETGKIGEMLEAAADELDRKSQARIKAFLSLLEPVAILLMGVVIGFIVVTMLSTILGINDIDF